MELLAGGRVRQGEVVEAWDNLAVLRNGRQILRISHGSFEDLAQTLRAHLLERVSRYVWDDRLDEQLKRLRIECGEIRVGRSTSQVG